MRPGDAVTLLAFLFFIVTGWLRRISSTNQKQNVALGLLGTVLIAANHTLSKHWPDVSRAIGDWLPCLLILLVYWQAGRFFGRPNHRLQTWLDSFDQRRIGAFLERWDRNWRSTWLGDYFEVAYLLCYVLVPLGVGVLYWAHLRHAIDEYWATVLPASYICYMLVPFAQTLPPRMLRCAAGPPPRGNLRALNLYILRHASIGLNMFPSGHVASTVGASLVLLRFAPAAGVLFLTIALSIAAGAVIGRYHYALDVIFGALLAVCVSCISTGP